MSSFTPTNTSNDDTNNTSSMTINDDEIEDEITRYSTIDKDGYYTIIAVFEGDYVRFARVEEWRTSRRKSCITIRI